MSPNSPPLVTVLMPTYKRPRLLRRAIKRVLNQTYPQLKLCIYDDGSGDETSEVVNEFAKNDSRIIYHCNEKNLGGILNPVQAMEHVSTPFFTFCADDDVFLPKHIEFAMDGFKKYPQAAFSYNQVICADEQGRIGFISHLDTQAGLYNPPEGVKLLLKDPGIITGLVIRKEVLESGITIDKDPGMLWDWGFSFQGLAKFPLAVTQKQGVIFVAHTSSYYTNRINSDEWPMWLKTYQKIVDLPNLDLETKRAVEFNLKRRFRSLVVKQGKQAILRENFSLANISAQTLKDFFDSPRHYFKLKFLAALCKLFPPYRWFLIFLGKRRVRNKFLKGNIRYQKYQEVSEFLRF